MATRSMDINAMRQAVDAGRIEWLRHTLERMMERDISRTEVKEVLLQGERIEDYPDDYPLPSALFLAWIGSRPLHVVAAFNCETSAVAIITVYEPTEDRFEEDFRTRKKR